MNFWEIEKWINANKETIERGFYLVHRDLKAILAGEDDCIRLIKATTNCCSDTFEYVLKQQLRKAVNSSLRSLGRLIIIEPTIIVADPILVDSYLTSLRGWFDKS